MPSNVMKRFSETNTHPEKTNASAYHLYSDKIHGKCFVLYRMYRQKKMKRKKIRTSAKCRKLNCIQFIVPLKLLYNYIDGKIACASSSLRQNKLNKAENERL